jgi:hypothetical protein
MIRTLTVVLLVLLQTGGLPPEAAVVPVQVGAFSGYSEGIVFDAAAVRALAVELEVSVSDAGRLRQQE